MRGILMVLALSGSVATASARTLSFSGGDVQVTDEAAMLVRDGKTLRIEAQFVAKGWGFGTVKGGLRDARVEDGRLKLRFEGVAPSGAVHQDNLPMLVVLSGAAADYPEGLVRLGNGAVAAFDKGSVWGFGKTVEFNTFGLRLSWDESLTQSFWNNPQTKRWSVRLNTKGTKEADGSTRFVLPLTVEKADVRISRPIDLLAQKRTQYGRVLYPPQERPLDVSKWIETIESKEMTREAFGPIEDLFDARSRLYSAAERLACKPTEDAEGEKLVAAGYAALNRMDHAGATNACAALERRLDGSATWMPFGTFSPFTWVKCFTQWGYRRAKDGCSVVEPNPWLVMWQDGFRLNLAQDERVVAANSAADTTFYETRYLKPMTDVRTERSWVDTKWLFPDGKTITFSLLTPVIDVDEIDALTISGLPSEPQRLRWTDSSGRSSGAQLVTAAPEEPEVVASALMDFKAPPPQKAGWTRGEQKVDGARPYYRLTGRGWSLALFPGERPTTAVWSKGVFTLKFPKKTWVGVLRLKDNLHACEQPEVCEFFARTTLAYPSACREVHKGNLVGWKYTYRMRENAWGTKPHVIAPVPPLVDFAEIPVAGARKFKYPTKWGLFRYCEGDRVACTLPADLPREPRLRGVNVGLGEDDAVWQAHLTNGCQWVRAVFGGKDLEPNYVQLEEKLKRWGGKMKFLVDPHCRAWRVNWKDGMQKASVDRFYAMWDRISKIGAKYPEAIEGYDLYNEPGIVEGSEADWREICETAARTIHRNHPGAKIYYSCVYGGNPNGLFNLVPLAEDCEPQVITYHFYSPHAFSHQKTATQNRGGDTCVFYPAWSAPIDWRAGNHFGGTSVDWYDRWTLAAVMLPVFEHYAEHRKPLHVGEYSIVGYANRKSPWGAYLWTRDATELIESQGASWHLWNGGFGLGNPLTRAYIYGLWQEGR